MFHSTKKLFKTPSLDYSSSLEFDLFSDYEDQSEGVTKAMGEPTMEEYMMKTREDYGPGIGRPKFDDKAHFELKGQFLIELRDNTFNGSDNEDANEHIEKVLEIVDLFHIPDETLKKKFLSKYCPLVRTDKKIEEINNFQQEPDETIYQAWERFKELLLRCPQHYLTDMQEVISFYKGLDVPTRQILDSKGVIPSMKDADAKKAIQDMADHSQKWHNRTSTRARTTDTSDGLAAIQAQLNNLGREINKVNDAQVGGRYRAAALGFYQRDNENPSYQERRQTMEESPSKFMAEYAKRHDENSNLIREIRATMDVVIRNQGASIKALEIQIGQMGKVLQERGSESLPISTETNPRDHIKSISTTIETETPSIYRRLIDDCYEEKEALKSLFMNKPRMRYQIEASMNVHDSVILEDALPPKEKDPGSFTIPCYINNICFEKALADLGASIDVLKRKITLKVGNDKIVFKSDKPTSNIIKRVYALGLRERMELDLEARLMGEALILNRSLDPTYGDYVKLNDLNEPLELRRNQVEDLGPMIEDGEVIDEFIKDIVETRNDDNEISNGIDEYPSFHVINGNVGSQRKCNHRISNEMVSIAKIIMAEGEIDNLTMEQYLALTRGNQAPSVVKPEIGGNVNFEIKSQFMRELREDTFSENKNNDAHEHVERVLDIVSLFNIPGVSHDAVMLRVFSITLTGSAKRWVDRLPPRTVDSWDLLKKPLSKGTVHHKKQPSSLKKPATSSRKETRLYTKHGNGPPRYYTRIDNRPPFREKRTSLEELMNKHLEESTRRRAEMEEWVKKLEENAEIDTRNQSASLKNLETDKNG
ncbi:hypothetical protein Tco_0722704 [Tanacetum coccineum]